jgi:hypothetical protein
LTKINIEIKKHWKSAPWIRGSLTLLLLLQQLYFNSQSLSRNLSVCFSFVRQCDEKFSILIELSWNFLISVVYFFSLFYIIFFLFILYLNYKSMLNLPINHVRTKKISFLFHMCVYPHENAIGNNFGSFALPSNTDKSIRFTLVNIFFRVCVNMTLIVCETMLSLIKQSTKKVLIYLVNMPAMSQHRTQMERARVFVHT